MRSKLGSMFGMSIMLLLKDSGACMYYGTDQCPFVVGP